MDRNLRIYTRKRLRGKSFFNGFLKRFTVTNWILIINIIVFVLASILAGVIGWDKIFLWLALQPLSFFDGKIWTLLTSMFMHGGLAHLFVNMFSLFFIGSFIEKLIGRKRFFWLYLLSGLFAGLFFVFVAFLFGGSDIGARIFGSPGVGAVGASGAIFALGGLLAILTPKLRVYVFFFFPMKMWSAMVFLLGGLWILSIFGDLPIGNSAHFGGLIVGLGYGIYLRNKYKKKTQMISKYFSS